MTISFNTKGFTVMEVLMVLALVGIMSALAAPSFTRMIAKNRIKTTSSNLQISFMKARSEAVKRNASVSITPISNNWQNGWNVHLSSVTPPPALFIIQNPAATVSPEGGFTGNITFSANGRASPNKKFTITDSALRLPSDNKSRQCVSISLSGLPKIEQAKDQPVGCP